MEELYELNQNGETFGTVRGEVTSGVSVPVCDEHHRWGGKKVMKRIWNGRTNSATQLWEERTTKKASGQSQNHFKHKNLKFSDGTPPQVAGRGKTHTGLEIKKTFLHQLPTK